MAGANTHVPDPLSRQDLPMGRGSHPARHGGAWTWAAWARGPWGPVSAGPAVPTSRLGAKPTAPPGPRPAKGRLQDTTAEPQGCCLFPVGWPGGWLCLGAVPRGQRLCAWCHQVASLSVGEGHVRAGPPQVWFHSKGQPPQNDPCCPFLLFWDQQLGLCPRAPLGQTLLGRWEGPAWDHEHRWGSSLPHPHPPPLDNSKTKEGPVFRGNSGSPPQRASASPRSCGRCSGCPPRTRRAVGGGGGAEGLLGAAPHPRGHPAGCAQAALRRPGRDKALPSAVEDQARFPPQMPFQGQGTLSPGVNLGHCRQDGDGASAGEGQGGWCRWARCPQARPVWSHAAVGGQLLQKCPGEGGQAVCSSSAQLQLPGCVLGRGLGRPLTSHLFMGPGPPKAAATQPIGADGWRPCRLPSATRGGWPGPGPTHMS